MIRYLLLLIILFVSCSKNEMPVSKQVARISMQSEPTSLDPRKVRDLDGGVILRMLFEGLMRGSNQGSIEPGVAEKVEISDDGLRYVFHLRKAAWSNGKPLTAADFFYAWTSILDPKFATDIAYHLFPIKNAKEVKMGEKPMSELGIQVQDPQTLIVYLEHSTPYFLELVATPPFFPVPETVVRNNQNWAEEAATLISNGPFQMDLWRHADQLTFKKNQHYWESKEVCLSKIELCIATSDTALRCFEENKLDWMGSPLSTIPIDALSSLKAANQLESCPFLATGFCRLNVNAAIGEKENPLSKPQFRRALALSLDRSSIVNYLLRGGQTVATELVPKPMGLTTDGYFADNSVDAALDLMNQIRGEKPFQPIVISYRNSETNLMIAQVMQKQWQEKLGIQVEIEAVEPKVYFQRVSRKEFQIALGSWTADFNDPVNFLEVFKFKDNGTNNTGWENSEYIDLLNQSALCMDLQERKEILRRAEAILMAEMPIIPIYHFALNYVKNSELVGAFLSPQGCLDLRTASFVKQ